jgi:hypothetical protein
MRPPLPLLMGLLSFLLGCVDRAKPGPFQQKEGAWHYRDRPIEGADRATFTPFDDHYAKDARRVYYGDTYRDGQEYYLVKHARVRPVEGADAATFVLMTEGYARDASHVYFEGERFAARDPASFQVLGDGFARDRVAGYYMREPVAGSDGRTFARLDDHYARDAARVYHADVDRRDAGAVRVRRLDGADAAAFRALDDGYATDGRRVWYEGEALTSDARGFAALGFGYAKNGAEVFYMGEPIPGADAATFALEDAMMTGPDAHDRHGVYEGGRRVVADSVRP